MTGKTCASCGKPIPPQLVACAACSAKAETVEGATAHTPMGSRETAPPDPAPAAVAGAQAGAAAAVAAPWQPTKGQKLSNRYELRKEIGRGGMGRVWLAHDLDLNLDVAIKLLPPEVMQDTRAQRELKKEAKRSITLSHPHIVKLHTYRAHGEQQYLVMEYVDGPTLDTYLYQQGALSETQVAEFLMEICAGLGEAHRQGIIHRDIKPHNLLLGKDGRVKISDFGIARAMTDSTMRATGKTVGTPLYMSPEQIRGRECDGRSDLYSLGVTAYQLLTSVAPFKTGDIAYQHMNEPPPPIPDRAPLLWPIIETLLAKDAAARYQNVEELAAALIATGLVQPSSLGAHAQTDTKPPVISLLKPFTRGRPADPTAKTSRSSNSYAVTRGKRGWIPAAAALAAIAVAGTVVLMTLRANQDDDRKLYSNQPDAKAPAPSAVSEPAPDRLASSAAVNAAATGAAARPPVEPPAGPASAERPAVLGPPVTVTEPTPAPQETPGGGADGQDRILMASVPPSTPPAAVAPTPIPAHLAGLPAAEVLRVAYEGTPPPAPAGAPVPELQFEIYSRREGTSSPSMLQNGDALISEVDEYVVLARPLTQGYLYVFQLDSHGNKYWLFPRNDQFELSVGANPLAPNTIVQVPGKGNVFWLDESIGVEHVYVVFSAAPWPELEEALTNTAATSGASTESLPPTIVERVVQPQEVGTTIASTFQNSRYEVAKAITKPNGLLTRGIATRGIGGARMTLASADARVQFEEQTFTVAVKSNPVTAAGSFLVLERWFHHVAPE